MGDVRRRFWLEAGAGTLTGVMFVVTAIWPDWIERVLGEAPDAGDGSLEWMLVAALALVTLVLGLLARAEWSRARRPATS